MENRNTRRGFTLIEILVAVLIIGVLAAIAISQYQTLSERFQVVEALDIMRQLQKEVDMYVWNRGYPRVEWVNAEDLQLGFIPQGTHIGQGWRFVYKKWVYRPRCWGTSCWIDLHRAGRNKSKSFHDYADYYELKATKIKNQNGQWTYECIPFKNSSLGKNICTYLRRQGWTYNE